MARDAAAFPHERYFKAAIAAGTLALLVFARPVLRKFIQYETGKNLNARAWRATFSERHLTVPSGPRDGFWAERLTDPKADPSLGWLNAEMHIPRMIDIDAHGLQSVSNDPHPKNHVLIVGASVAFGAYASSEDRAYFAQCADRLRALKRKTKITILATGGWRSVNESAAFQKEGLGLHPGLVIFIDSLNDLTQHREIPVAQRVSDFLTNARESRDAALMHHLPIVFMAQPFLPDKPDKSFLEMIIIRESYWPLPELIRANRQVRQGLQALTIPGKVFFIDSSDVFNQSSQTIFTDIWHFTDVGHAIFGAYLAEHIAPLLKP